MSFLCDQNIFTLPPQPVSLRRPPALIRAAQAGQSGWRRERDLPRLLGRETAPAGPAALRILRATEEAADHARRARHPDYDMHRHVRLLIALLAEITATRTAAALPVGQVLPFSARGTDRPARRA